MLHNETQPQGYIGNLLANFKAEILKTVKLIADHKKQVARREEVKRKTIYTFSCNARGGYGES